MCVGGCLFLNVYLSIFVRLLRRRPFSDLFVIGSFGEFVFLLLIFFDLVIVKVQI